MPAQPLLNHRYRILKSLGEGGFGRTFLAEDTHMPSQRQCVIKQLKPVSHRPEVHQLLQDRFAREAAVLETVGKANNQIPTLYAYFIQKNQFYLVQEWIRGETLTAASHSEMESVTSLLTSLLKTLAYVHRHNIIHRDIKPENIIVRSQDQSPCLIDFGAVKEVMSTVLSPSGSLKSSLVIGTAGFMPPEQMAGHPVFASDLYSLGLTIISLLTRRSPNEIPTDSHTGQKLWQQYAPNATQPLIDTLTKATYSQANQRYATATEMLAALNPASIQLPQPLVATTLARPKPSPTALQTVAVTEASHTHPSQSSANHFNLSTVLTGIAIASLTGIGLFIQFGPNPQSSVSRSTVTPTASQTAEQPDRASRNTPNEHQTRQPESNDPKAQLAEARSLYEAGRNAAALEVAERILQNDPESVEAIALKADILANQTQRDLPGAIKLYTQALSIQPSNIELLTKRCKAYASLKNWADAETDCTKALESDPSSVNLYGRRGDIRTAQENYEGAVDDYTQAIELNASAGREQQNQSLYFRRFTALGKLNRAEEALADMEKVRSLPSTQPAAD